MRPDLPSQETRGVDAQEMRRIYQALDKVRKKSPAGALAKTILSGKPPSGDTNAVYPLMQAIARPDQRNWQERLVAAWALGHTRMQLQDRRNVIQTLTDLLQRRLEPSWKQAANLSARLALLIALLPAACDRTLDPAGHYLGSAIGFFLISMPFTLALSGRNSAKVRSEAARTLGALQALEAFDAVVAATQEKQPIRSAAVSTLYGLLPLLTPDWYGYIRSETQQTLCRILGACDEELAILIVQSFRSIGDRLALVTVQRLAEGRGRAQKEPRLQQAALQALPAIRERMARQSDPHTLLRASSLTSLPEQLLRPAYGGPENADPAELLRASLAEPREMGALTLAIIEDLKQRGDARALPALEQMLASSGVPGELKRAAEECRSTLRARVELQRYAPPASEEIINRMQAE